MRHLALFDTHIPRNINLKEIIAYIKWYQPTHFILGGDFLDMSLASHWNTPQFSNIGWESVNRYMAQEFGEDHSSMDLLSGNNSTRSRKSTRHYAPAGPRYN
mgnify:CR=1 FL=1